MQNSMKASAFDQGERTLGGKSAGRRAPLASAVLMLAMLAGVGGVRAEECLLDNCADRKAVEEPLAHSKGGRGKGRVGEFDFYVLTLSWSPAFCALEGSARRRECEPGGHAGFVVHGLWPQYEKGGYPHDCSGARTPSRIALERAQSVYPDEGLARHEWRKHGTCVGASPAEYFADIARARESIAIPQPLVRPDDAQNFAPIDIERAFLAANPRLLSGMMAVSCRNGALEDVRICFSKDLRAFHACPDVARRGCRAREISVPPTY